jgi:putative transposase
MSCVSLILAHVLPTQGQDDTALRKGLRDLAHTYWLFWFLRLHLLLLAINRKHAHHLSRKEALIVRLMHRRKRPRHLQITTPCPRRGIEQLSRYLVADMLLNGRRVRRLTIVDNRSRHRSMRSIPP